MGTRVVSVTMSPVLSSKVNLKKLYCLCKCIARYRKAYLILLVCLLNHRKHVSCAAILLEW